LGFGNELKVKLLNVIDLFNKSKPLEHPSLSNADEVQPGVDTESRASKILKEKTN
jgi:hypothetical protein